MTQGGFEFHGIWQNLVDYLRKLDVEKLKRQAFYSRAKEIFIFGAGTGQDGVEERNPGSRDAFAQNRGD